MRIILTFLVSVFIICGVVSSATAQELNTSEACTVVRSDEVAATDDRWVYCDIYMRQFQHREKMRELEAALALRADNYRESFKPVIDNYKAELKRYHDSMGSDSEEKN